MAVTVAISYAGRLRHRSSKILRGKIGKLRSPSHFPLEPRSDQLRSCGYASPLKFKQTRVASRREEKPKESAMVR